MGKQALGCALWPGGLWPCGLLDTRKQAHGGTLSRVADTPMALMVPRKRREGCIARGKGLRPSGRIDSRERGEGAPLSWIEQGMRLTDVRMSRRVPAIDEEGTTLTPVRGPDGVHRFHEERVRELVAIRPDRSKRPRRRVSDG